ncbi:MAG: hypothetical protein EBR82_39575 [Caulobacteraceae bacterium]|nr:hypothetical protein [Caulobacteraceae bacterium]
MTIDDLWPDPPQELLEELARQSERAAELLLAEDAARQGQLQELLRELAERQAEGLDRLRRPDQG